MRRVWKILFTPSKQNIARRNESKNEICVTFINESEGEEKIYNIKCVSGVWEHFTNSLNAFTPALSTIKWVLGCFYLMLLGFAFLSRAWSLIHTQPTDSSFLQGNIRGCRRKKSATPRKEKKKENSVKWACMIRLWGGTEKGRLQPELYIVGSPHHCDSTLKLISEFFASMTLGNLEVWCLTPIPTPSTHFPMQSSRCHRQTNKTYRISV